MLTDQLPSGLTFISATGTGWQCGSVATIVTCTVTDVLQVGDSASVSLVTNVTCSPGHTIVHTAMVEGGASGSGSATDDADLTLPTAVLASTGAGFAAQLGAALLLLGVGVLLRMAASRRWNPQEAGR